MNKFKKSQPNVLILHRLGDPLKQREAVRTLELMFQSERSDFNILSIDAQLPLPFGIKFLDIDIIIIGPTFFGARYNSRKFIKFKQRFSFLTNSKSIKIGLPQDEYDCSKILDDWLVDMKIDIVYSVLKDCWDIIYPKFQKVGKLQFGYTSYIPDDWVLKWANPKSYEDREIDVSYRAKHLPENFGRLGQLKYLIAEKFKNSIIVTNVEGTKKINTRVFDVIKFS